MGSGQTNENDEGASVPTQHRSAFVSFLRQLGTFTGDLSQLTAPTFLLNGTSLLEYSLHWCDHPKLLFQISTTDDPAERMLEATRWFISTLYGSYHERCADGSEKKPYNPILGEQFFCKWNDDKDEGWKSAESVVEQVSHHPPISAFYVSIPSADISVTGHCGQKSKFNAMYVKVEQTGRAHLDLLSKKEIIQISLPELYIRGILSGNIFLDLCGSCHLVSSTGYISVIEFLPKPWFSGSYHNIKGSIYMKGSESSPLYTISGNWTTKSYFKPSPNASISKPSPASSTGEYLLFDASISRPNKIIKPTSEQGELESRKIWEKVTVALKEGNFGAASKEKHDIEERQREIRKEREAKNIPWIPKYFTFCHDKDDNHNNNLLGKNVENVKSSIDIGYYKFNGGARFSKS